MKLNFWVKAAILIVLWLLLAYLIQLERSKKDQQIVGELAFVFPSCEGVNLWEDSIDFSQIDSLIKALKINAVVMDISEVDYRKKKFPDRNYQLINESALKNKLHVYLINPETLVVNEGWKRFSPSTFYPIQYNYAPYFTKDSLINYWSLRKQKHLSLMDTIQASSGIRFIRNLRNGTLDSMYQIQILYSTSFRNKVNELVFKNVGLRWLIVVHRPAHGYSWLSFRKTPRYRVLN